MSNKERSFGVGCLTLAFDDPPETVSEWATKVRATLGDIAAVGDLSVESNLEVGLIDVDGALTPTIGRVEFTVTIPARIQAELNPHQFSFKASGDTFRVVTILGFYAPTTFVFCEKPSDGPATGVGAVFFVRKFLDRELSRSTHAARLITVGPSPFHSDFRLIWDDADSFENVPSDASGDQPRGYIDPQRHLRPWGVDTVITCRPNQSDDSFDFVTDIVLDALRQELSLFYRLVLDRDERMELAQELTQRSDQLVDIHRTSGIRGTFARLLRTSGIARDLMLDAIAAEALQREHELNGRESVRNLHSSVYAWKLFTDELNAQIDEDFSPAIESARKMGELLEGSRKKEYEILMLSASTLLGAAAGAIAALIAG